MEPCLKASHASLTRPVLPAMADHFARSRSVRAFHQAMPISPSRVGGFASDAVNPGVLLDGRKASQTTRRFQKPSAAWSSSG